jgi:putative phosphoribosyl transferase
VLIIDDGLATGSTAIAACEVARSLGALHIVVAVPVAPPEAAARLADHADEFISLRTPPDFRAVGQFYEHFGQVTDHEVLDVLDACSDHEPWSVRPAQSAQSAQSAVAAQPASAAASTIVDAEVVIEFDGVSLPGHLTVPDSPIGVVLFAHGSGSSRHSPRNTQVAEVLHAASIGTLLFDLLTEDEEVDRANVFDIDLLAGRLLATTAWVRNRPDCAELPIGYFGASTGAGAALRAAAVSSIPIAAVVSRGGRPDLAGMHLKDVTAPTLLIIGGRDSTVIDLNCDAAELLAGEVRMVIIAGASHLFEEPGTLLAAANEARDWFRRCLSGGNAQHPGNGGKL